MIPFASSWKSKVFQRCMYDESVFINHDTKVGYKSERYRSSPSSAGFTVSAPTSGPSSKFSPATESTQHDGWSNCSHTDGSRSGWTASHQQRNSGRTVRLSIIDRRIAMALSCMTRPEITDAVHQWSRYHWNPSASPHPDG